MTERNMKEIENQMNQKLVYDEQIVFKKFIKKHFGFKKDFYFDCVTGVDGKTDRDIKGVRCDGTLTWNQNLIALRKHFEKK